MVCKYIHVTIWILYMNHRIYQLQNKISLLNLISTWLKHGSLMITTFDRSREKNFITYIFLFKKIMRYDLILTCKFALFIVRWRETSYVILYKCICIEKVKHICTLNLTREKNQKHIEKSTKHIKIENFRNDICTN